MLSANQRERLCTDGAITRRRLHRYLTHGRRQTSITWTTKRYDRARTFARNYPSSRYIRRRARLLYYCILIPVVTAKKLHCMQSRRPEGFVENTAWLLDTLLSLCLPVYHCSVFFYTILLDFFICLPCLSGYRVIVK